MHDVYWPCPAFFFCSGSRMKINHRLVMSNEDECDKDSQESLRAYHLGYDAWISHIIKLKERIYGEDKLDGDVRE